MFFYLFAQLFALLVEGGIAPAMPTAAGVANNASSSSTSSATAMNLSESQQELLTLYALIQHCQKQQQPNSGAGGINMTPPATPNGVGTCVGGLWVISN